MTFKPQSLSWLLLKHFTNILFNMSVEQVDREERPDVDKVNHFLQQKSSLMS